MKVIADNLSKHFFSLRGKTQALKSISLEILDGELFVLLGPSGCGKSTLLNLIAGIEQPTYGKILFDDQIMFNSDSKTFVPPQSRNVAFVFQNYALYPHLNVFENLAFPLRNKRELPNIIKEKVHSTAKQMEIEDLLKAHPSELSGGQKQRVAIARAIIRTPNVFLMDEPLSNLDAKLRIAMRFEIKKLQQKLGITTIYVTHDQIEAMSLGDRIAILNDGKIEQTGTAYELYEKPLNPFVAGFIGTPPMNLIQCRISKLNHGNIEITTLENQSLIIPSSTIDALKISLNSCILGIRAEDVEILKNEDENYLSGEIISIEPHGKENLLRIKHGENIVSVFTTDKSLKISMRIKLKFNTSKLHFF